MPCTLSIESGNEAKSDWPMWSRSAGTAMRSRSAAGGDERDDRVAHDPAHHRRPHAAPLRPVAAEERHPEPVDVVAEDGKVAGRNVNEPMTAMRTTEIVPMAIDRKSTSSSRNRPPMENITASPEKNTARPAVADATRIASYGWRPWRRSVR